MSKLERHNVNSADGRVATMCHWCKPMEGQAEKMTSLTNGASQENNIQKRKCRNKTVWPLAVGDDDQCWKRPVRDWL